MMMADTVPNHAQAKKIERHPPGPRGHSLWGVSREFRRDTLGYMERLVNVYGPAVRFRFIPGFYGYLFCHPDQNKQILQENNRNYSKRPHPAFELLAPVLGRGLVTNEGDSWLQQRRLMQPVFHRQHIAAFGATMTEATVNMLARWHVAAANRQPLDMDHEMTQLTLEIVGKTLFSIDLTGEADRVGQAFTRLNRQIADLNTVPFSNYMIKMPFLPNTRRINQNIAIVDDVVNRIIAERRQAEERQSGNPGVGREIDLLDMLIAARDEESGEGMDDRQLRDEVVTLLLAGHETTANTLSWTWYLLSQHAAAATKLQEELARVLNGRVPTMSDLPDLPYTRMVIDEALRLYPPAYAIGRWATAADEITGYDIPANAVITLSPFLTHRLPEFWPEPEKFEPERFTPEESARRPRYAYLPFGGGPRQCIGNVFALTEAQLILATIARHYRPRLQPGHQVALDPLITLRPRGGLPMLIDGE
jgi:cytochrome P450